MYIGDTVITQGFTPQVDFFSGNASTTAFTLSRPVASTYQMIVNVANVDQNPGSAYTVTGNTITFASAPPSGTNNIWVEYTSLITQTIAPSPGTVGAAQLPQSQILTSVQQPTGSVIQVVQGTYNQSGGGYLSTASTSFITTALTASITPQFSTSKILVSVSIATYAAGNGNGTALYTVYRNGSNIGPANGFIEANSSNWATLSTEYLDSPSSTSSLAYTVYLRTTNASYSAYAYGDSVLNTITLKEIR